MSVESLLDLDTCPACGSARLGRRDHPDLLGEHAGFVRLSCVSCSWTQRVEKEFDDE